MKMLILLKEPMLPLERPEVELKMTQMGREMTITMVGESLEAVNLVRPYTVFFHHHSTHDLMFLQNRHETHPLKLKPALDHNPLQNNPNVNAKTRPNAVLKKPPKRLQKLSG